MEQRYVRTGDTYTYEKIELPTVGTVVVIDDARLMELPEYSFTTPTGVFDNKMWRRRENEGWCVCEYVPHPNKPGWCRTVVRRAASPETIALAAEGVFWWLPA